MNIKLPMVLSVALAVLLLATFAGCAGQTPSPAATPTPKPTPTSTASSSPTPQSPTPKPSPTPVVQPKYGGIIQYPINRAIGGFDAHKKAAFSPFATWLVFSHLVGFSPTNPELSLQNIVPELAERWTVSSDGLTYTFYLAKNVKWHDGNPFTADDVVYSLQKMADPKRSVLSSSMPPFDTVQKVDDYTVKVVLKNPSASFLVTLAGPYAPIEAKHKADANPQTSEFLVGTGPFKFKSMTSGVSYEFVKNPDYWRKDPQGNKLPFLDGVQMTIMPDPSAQTNAFLTNRFDMMQPNVGVPNAQILSLIRTQAKDAITAPQPMPLGYDFYFNMTYGPFKDVRVRKAIALLVDPAALAIARFGSDEFAEYNSTIFSVPYGIPKAESDKLLGRDKPFDQRVTEAQKLMADAGYASGFPVRILSGSYVINVSSATYLGDVLRRYLKMDVKLDMLETTASYKARDAGDFDIYQVALQLGGDPDDLIPYFLSGSPANFMKYSNPALDKLWQDQSQATDLKKRIGITQQIERTLLTDLPVAPSDFAVQYVAWKPYVKGFVLHNTNYGPEESMENVWLNK